MLVGKNIFKLFGKKGGLKDVSVSIVPGQITALIGPSGGGKSTLIRALSLLDPPDSGSITIEDTTYIFPKKNISSPQPPWPKVTIVFQQLFLWPHLTIRQNITLPVENNDPISCKGSLEQLIDLFEMAEFIDRYPNEVSLGQRQRAAIARALILKPKYLLLDEITSALDVEHVSKLLSHLKALRSEGMGILLITHLIGFAKRAADQILFMEDGEIKESGGRELLANPQTVRLSKFLSLIETAS